MNKLSETREPRPSRPGAFPPAGENRKRPLPERIVSLLLCVMIACALTVPTVGAHDRIEVHGSRKAVKISTDVVLGALPTAALVGVLVEKDWEGLKQGAFTAAATLGATYILKYSVHEWRPDYSDHHSFPSGHSSCTFATAAFLQRRYGWKFGAPAYALATYTAWGRVYAKRHHWWDVVTGAAIGAGSAYIFTRPWARDHELTVTPATDGYNHSVTLSFTL